MKIMLTCAKMLKEFDLFLIFIVEYNRCHIAHVFKFYLDFELLNFKFRK